MSKFIHDPSKRCRVDWRGVNLFDLLPGPVEGRRLVVSVGGILGEMTVARCLIRLYRSSWRTAKKTENEKEGWMMLKRQEVMTL